MVLMRFFNTDVVNSYALRLAGVNRATPDPDQGRIERDEDGEPNGLLRAKAKGLVRCADPAADRRRNEAGDRAWAASRCSASASPASSSRG